MENNQFDVNWNYPTIIRNGIGRISELPQACRELGMSAPLLVTDSGLVTLPMITNAVDSCLQDGLECSVFSQIKSNPTRQNVEDGVSAYKDGKHDGVIAFGGGSALDAAKAIALLVGQDRPLWDFEDVGDNYTRVNVKAMAPVVAIPTTSGTGSEVGRASVITDEVNHIKRIIFHPNMLPEIVILDAALTEGLPAKITAATGMDALSHALEAYCSPYYHPMGDGIALEAIRLLKENLITVTNDGSNLSARAHVMTASTMGATAFQKGLGGMHALAHPLGALYDSHHGLLNAILMPYILVANRSSIEDKIQRLCRYIQLTEDTFDCFITWIISLKKVLNIPHSLGEIGINSEKAELVGKMAFNDAASGGNPILFTHQQYTEIFMSAVNGELNL